MNFHENIRFFSQNNDEHGIIDLMNLIKIKKIKNPSIRRQLGGMKWFLLLVLYSH